MVGILVEEEVGKVNCRVGNGHGLPPVPKLHSKVYMQSIAGGNSKGGEDEDVALGLVGLVAGEADSQKIGGAALWSLLAMYGGCGSIYEERIVVHDLMLTYTRSAVMQ